MTLYRLAATLLVFFALNTTLSAQYIHDITHEIEVPGIVDLESSETHLYVLSESEGLVVYRAYPDSLQWLYTSTGMQRRGNKLHADIRFAYLYGNSRRLTVIEPTSVLGVYSSTVLPDVPVSTRRIGNNLYIALRSGALVSVGLQTPESVDTEPVSVDPDRFGDRIVNDLATDENRTLYVLSDNRFIDVYRFDSTEEQLVTEDNVELDQSLENIFFADNELIGSSDSGDIYLIDSNGNTRLQNNLGQPLDDLGFWADDAVIRSLQGQLWVGRMGGDLTPWKTNQGAGNHFAINKNRLFVTEFNSIFPVKRSPGENMIGDSENVDNVPFSIEPIETVTLPFPKPLILPINIRGYSGNISDVTLSVESPINDIQVRGSSLFWQPGASDTGRHTLTVTASTPNGRNSQVSFTVDVKPFNSPPRFTPSREQSLPAGERFELQITAFDPDGTHPDLIRYLGVDLPNGASLNEQTGIFEWEPNIRQVGSHTFRVIATDQFGAAASQDYTMQVMEINDSDVEETENSIDSQ